MLNFLHKTIILLHKSLKYHQKKPCINLALPELVLLRLLIRLLNKTLKVPAVKISHQHLRDD